MSLLVALALFTQVVMPINGYDQHVYTTDSPNDPALLGLATNNGRYAMTLLDGCDNIVSGLNVMLYFSDYDFWIIPLNDDGRFSDMVDERGLPSCHIALGARMSDMPCFTVWSDLFHRNICDVIAEAD